MVSGDNSQQGSCPTSPDTLPLYSSFAFVSGTRRVRAVRFDGVFRLFWP